MAFELVNKWQEVVIASMTLIIMGIVLLALANVLGAQILRVAAFTWIAAGIITPLVQLIYDWLMSTE